MHENVHTYICIQTLGLMHHDYANFGLLWVMSVFVRKFRRNSSCFLCSLHCHVLGSFLKLIISIFSFCKQNTIVFKLLAYPSFCCMCCKCLSLRVCVAKMCIFFLHRSLRLLCIGFLVCSTSENLRKTYKSPGSSRKLKNIHKDPPTSHID